jgi:signal transduction histidine kinase
VAKARRSRCRCSQWSHCEDKWRNTHRDPERRASRGRVLDVVDDRDGNLWLTTTRAIAKLSRDQWAAFADTLAHRLRETIARSRNMVWSLHSTAVVQFSLVEVLRHAEAEFRLGELPQFELSSTGEARDIHPLVRDEVYRICREALANAFRHSNAHSVQVIVRFQPEIFEVEIRDDGQGIDDEIRLHGRPGHFGLPGMQAHAERIGAGITIHSAPGQGTTIHLRVKTHEPRWTWPKLCFWPMRRKTEIVKGTTHESDHGRN